MAFPSSGTRVSIVLACWTKPKKHANVKGNCLVSSICFFKTIPNVYFFYCPVHISPNFLRYHCPPHHTKKSRYATTRHPRPYGMMRHHRRNLIVSAGFWILQSQGTYCGLAVRPISQISRRHISLHVVHMERQKGIFATPSEECNYLASAGMRYLWPVVWNSNSILFVVDAVFFLLFARVLWWYNRHTIHTAISSWRGSGFRWTITRTWEPHAIIT